MEHLFDFTMPPIITSPMNYIGGKRRILSQLLPLFPQNISTCVDLFCGGCSVGINVEAKQIIFNDNIAYLIEMYRSFLLTEEKEVLQYIDARIEELELTRTNKEGFLKLRSAYNSYRHPLDLFVLIAFSFNHQIRFNSAHEYNNPFGKERSSYNPKMQENLKSFLRALKTKEVRFTHLDFRDFDYADLNANDFVYADPPYLITRGTYNDGKRGFTGWGETEEKALLRILDTLEEKGVKFALSNVLTHKGQTNDLLREWIATKPYTVHPLHKSYTNSNYQTANNHKGETQEVLITNYTKER